MLPTVLASSVIRSTHRGDSHGGVYRVNLETEKITQILDWNNPDINWEGDVTPCCGSYDYKQDSLGNVFETDIYKIWNNEKYMNSRLRLKNKLGNGNTLCSKCLGGTY